MSATASPFTAHSQVVPLRGVLMDIHATAHGMNAAGRAAKAEFDSEWARQERQRKADIAHEEQTEGHSFPHRIDRNE